MRIEQLGTGVPDLAIVGAIHGDEPCGADAIETLLEENPSVKRPVKCIIANERALEQSERYVEIDVNRAFPGSPTADVAERRLAYHLFMELAGCTTLSLHSTQSTEHPFAIVNTVGPLATGICPYLSVDAIVETAGFVGQTLVNYASVVEVECGFQGSEQATENAEELIREFLIATGAIPSAGSPAPNDKPIPIYQLQKRLSKPPGDTYSTHVNNFEPVGAGSTYASIDERELIADEPFYPVLMSPYGYDEQFGYAASLTGALG